MNLEDRLRSHLQATDVDPTVPSPEPIVQAARRRTSRNRAVAAVVAAGALLGGVAGAAALIREPSVVDVASPNSTIATTADAEAADEPDLADILEDGGRLGDTIGQVGAAPLSDAMALEFMERPIVVGVPDGFAALRWSPEGVLALRSADGISWTESPTTGLEGVELAFIGGLAHHDGTFAALVLDPEGLHSSGAIATSTDLRGWTVHQLMTPDETEVHVQSVAVSDTAVVVSGVGSVPFFDPVTVAVDLGLLEQSALLDNCGVFWLSRSEPIEVLACDTDEPLLVLEPGDVGFDEIYSSASGTGEGSGDVIVWSGSADGDFSMQRFETSGFASPTVVAEAGRLALFDGDTVRLSSDGDTWSDPIPTDTGVFQTAAFAGSAHTVNIDGGAAIITSVALVDGSTTTVELPLPDGLFSGWLSAARSGPAGVALFVNGTLDLGDGIIPEELPEIVTVEKDGYALTTGLDTGPLVVSAPDGSIVHDIADGSRIINDAVDVPGVARFDGEDDERLVILDPETGADLFAITREEFFNALDLDLDFDELLSGADTDIPLQTFEMGVSALLFSRDGVSWEVLTDGLPAPGSPTFASIEAIGDDEILIRIETIPAEPGGAFDQAADVEDGDPEDVGSQGLEPPTSELIRIPLN